MTADPTALIDRLALAPHPEGGWYRELFRSGTLLDTPRGRRAAVTSIYYLLARAQISRWHVVEADEIWHFYEGSPLTLLAYDPLTRQLREHRLGATPSAQRVAVIARGHWQAARCLADWSLMGCTVAPGFEFADFRFVADVAGHAAHFGGPLAAYASLL